MTQDSSGILGCWIEEHGQVAFELPVVYGADGSKSIGSCRRVLADFIEPIFREAGECFLFGTKLVDESFGRAGKAIQSEFQSAKGRKRLVYRSGILSQYVEFFSNERSDERMLADHRGTVAFVVQASSLSLRELICELAEPEVVRNYPTTMDRAGLTYARGMVASDLSKAVVCLPGRMGLDVVYVFAEPSVLTGLLTGRGGN